MAAELRALAGHLRTIEPRGLALPVAVVGHRQVADALHDVARDHDGQWALLVEAADTVAALLRAAVEAYTALERQLVGQLIEVRPR